MQSALVGYERYPGSAARPLSPSYRRREPDKTVLYDIVSRSLETCLGQAEEKSEQGYGYPRFVEREFEKFLNCGLLRRGFVRVRCSSCPNEKLVAFSCKGRGVCPSCTARRMASTAAHLVDNVLPEVPYRQWIISFPKRVRFLLARDHDLLSDVLNVCLRKIFAWQRRKARALGTAKPMCGAVTFCQRFGSLLNLNCHFHSLLPDGVFVDNGDDVEFVPLPPPRPEDIDRLVKQIARATEKLIERRTHEQTRDEPPDVLEVQQAQSIAAIRFPRTGDNSQPEQVSHKRAAFFFGYSLHAERHISADDRQALERLCRYGARAPIANSRLSIRDNGDAVVELKRPLRDGRTHLTFSSVELLQKLAILIPPPGKHLTRYHGLFGPAHRFRSAIVPAASTQDSQDAVALDTDRANDGDAQSEAPTSEPVRRSSRLSWAELLRRVFAIDILRCDQCGSAMKIIAVIPESPIADKILDHLGLELPACKATGPPLSGPAVR